MLSSRHLKWYVSMFVCDPDLCGVKMVKNIFQNKYAEVLIAKVETTDGSQGEAVGLALVGLENT
jgi:hypothetical protein